MKITTINHNHHMKRFLTLILAAFCLTTLPAAAQKSGSSNDYNLQKAYEILREEGDEVKALELLGDQLKQTPDNVDALLLRTRVYRNREEYGSALGDVNHAIKVNKPKKTEVCNSTLYWWRATIFSEMGEKEKGVADYRTALELSRKDNPENVQQISFDYGQALFSLDRLDEADAVYRQMLREDETDQAAMLGLARNCIEREQYSEAVAILDRCEKFDADYSQIYRFRMRAYDKLGEHDKAIDDALEYCDKDSDGFGDEVIELLKKHPNYAVAKVKAKTKKSENPAAWHALLAGFYGETSQYELAIKEYNLLENDYGKSASIYLFRSDCYNELGMTEKAIEDISKAMEKDPSAYEYLTRGDYYREAGMYEQAIADFSSAIEEAPDVSFGYYRRGWCYELSGNLDKALEDYNLGIDIDSDYPYLFLMRAEAYITKGEKAKAEEDLRRIIQLDTVANNGSCRQYALHLLGKDDEAAEWMQKVIDNDPEEKGNYYDKACLYSKMGRLDEAMEAFSKCLDMGYRSFGHIEHDDDLDAIRGREDFKEAVSKAKERLSETLNQYEIENPYSGQEVVEVAMVRHPGGTFEIPCEINGLPLQMVFDTGASDVTISSVEANFMLKNEYLSEKDIKGKRYYQIASGQLSEGTVITLREVKIGDAVLKNVDASVVKSQKAPLLLGQSAMEKFGAITIDNTSNKLFIKR